VLSDSNDNTAVGTSALNEKTHGAHNTATGDRSLEVNTGSFNVGLGDSTLTENSSGEFNSAAGTYALLSNTTGTGNTALGYQALAENTTGGNNIAIGTSAGEKLTTGSNNIDIGNPGAEDDADTIKIGVSGTQTATFVAGISTAKLTGAAVYVNAKGQLGVLASSERYKTSIKSLESNDEKLQRLRPVTFLLKNEPDGALQYGLIAEEVAKVYPELVIRDRNGRIDGVRYDELAPILLNEVKKQSVAIQELKRQQRKMIVELEQQMAEMRTALHTLHAANQLIAKQ
jgi:hypothetical protein